MSYKEQITLIFTKTNISKCILFAVIPSILFYSFFLVGLWSVGFSTMEILRDPAQQTHQSSFLGFLSNIGNWLWISSAAICFFSATIGKSSLRKLLVFIGLLSTILAIDDFFLIHDRYVNQNLCYLLYAFLAVTLFTLHFKKILKIDAFSFLLAGSLLALSILTDLIQLHIPLSYSKTQVIEEGFKFMGISIWLYFSCRVASYHLKNLNNS
jgi:hypothetical protein